MRWATGPPALSRTTSDLFFFAMIPEDLLYSEVSDAALRVYGAIQRAGLGTATNLTHAEIGAKLGPRSKRVKNEDEDVRGIPRPRSSGRLPSWRRRAGSTTSAPGPLGHHLPSVYKPLKEAPDDCTSVMGRTTVQRMTTDPVW